MNIKQRNNRYYEQNKEKINKRKRDRYDKDKAHEIYLKNKENLKIKRKIYLKNNPEKKKVKKKHPMDGELINKRNRTEYYKKYRLENIAKMDQYAKQYGVKYREENKDKIKEYQKKHKNKLKLAKDQRAEKAKYMRDRYRKNSNHRFASIVRSRINKALKTQNATKYNRSIKLLGCSSTEGREHIESLFLVGMTWENHGLWHIDHKIPIASFDLTDAEQQKLCFHYTNLQPLWAEDNLKKGAKIIK